MTFSTPTLPQNYRQKGVASWGISTSLRELPEFARDALEELRQPLEDGIVNVSCVHASYAHPAD